MLRRIVFLSALLIAFGTCWVGLSSSAHAASGGKFYVPVNRSEIISTKSDMGEVIVADPEVADVYVHGKNKLSIIGKKLGITSVRLFDANNALLREMEVHVTYDLPAIRRALKEFLPTERVGVEMVNTKIALTGDVSSTSAANTALEIASQFVQPVRAAESVGIPNADEKVPYPDIVNLMKLSSGQQVMLRIRVGEVQRTTLKHLGVNLQAFSGSSPFAIATGLARPDTLQQGFQTVTVPGADFGGLGADFGNLRAVLTALERNGMFKTLAEPNLVAISGERAEFLAGGEIPIPVPQSGDSDTITIEYKPFGVGVQFTPYVLAQNRIRVQVQPEVSAIDTSTTTTIGGLTVPAFITRRASTTVELAPGETFMIAGLIQDNLRSTINSLPGVSEIPILSAFFRDSGYTREETELVLAVTPYIVDPIKSTDVKLPTDEFRNASFMEAVFYGAIGSLSGNVDRISQTPSLEGPIGFMVD